MDLNPFITNFLENFEVIVGESEIVILPKMFTTPLKGVCRGECFPCALKLKFWS